MLYNVATLLKSPVGTDMRQPIDGEVAIESEDGTVIGPVEGEVRFQRANSGILATGSFTAPLQLTCARCLDTFATDLTNEFSEMFYPTIDVVTGVPLPQVDGEHDFTIDAHHHLNLAEALRQQIILNLPMQALCRTDCAGLCPICGGNRNEVPCDCEAREDAQNNPFAGLVELTLSSEEA